MADVQRPTGVPVPAETGRRSVRRRAGRWCAAALVAGSAVVVGAAPAAAAEQPYAVPALIDHPGKLLDVLLGAGSATAGDQPPAPAAESYPVLADHQGEQGTAIAPGASGQVKVGLKNSGGVDARNEGRMYMELWAPYGTRFTDTTLTPVDGALGGWSCRGDAGVEGQPYESTVLKCNSDDQGVVVPAGGTAHWQTNMKVYGDAPADTLLPNAGEGGYGAVLYHTDGGRGHWSTMSLTVMTSHAS